MVSRPKLSLAALAVVLVGGCGASTPEPATAGAEPGTMDVRAGYREYTGFLPTTDRPAAAREEGCEVEVLLEDEPSRPHVVLGMISAERVGQAILEMPGGEEQAIGWLLPVACRVGGHVIYSIETGSEREAYVGRSLRAHAIVAAYTDAAAAPVAAPPPPPAAPPPPPVSTGTWGPPPGGDETGEAEPELEPDL